MQTGKHVCHFGSLSQQNYNAEKKSIITKTIVPCHERPCLKREFAGQEHRPVYEHQIWLAWIL